MSDLMTYMTSENGPKRDAAWLRMYAEKIRNGTAATWEIPSTVAGTMDAVATRVERAELALESGEPGHYYAAALDLVADTIGEMSVDRFEEKRLKLVAIVRMAADDVRRMAKIGRHRE